MNPRILWLVALSFLLGLLLHSETSAGTPPPVQVSSDADQLDLFLLVGQSNMAGRGQVSPADRVPDARVFIFTKEEQWVNQGEPIHFDKPEIVGVGLGFTFAKLVADHNPGRPVGLIPCAVGGTPISRWKPGGDLFEEAVRRAQLAMKSGKLKAILWHQGESEAGGSVSAAAYGRNLVDVATGFRKALGCPEVPFVAGEIGRFLYDPARSKLNFAREVNDGIGALPGKAPHTAVVSSEGLTDKGDGVHFDSESQKELGQRYFKSYSSLVNDRDIP